MKNLVGNKPLCPIDHAPAATLLIPHFRVDVSRCGKSKAENTLFTVVNADSAPTTAYVTVWTDWSVPTFSFNVHMAGYDTQGISLKWLFCEGALSATDGPISPPVNSATLQSYQQWTQGKRSELTGNCASTLRSSDIATGYVTVDNVQTPVGGNPSDGASYLDHLSNTNQLTTHVYHRYLRTGNKGKSQNHTEQCTKDPEEGNLPAQVEPQQESGLPRASQASEEAPSAGA